jgi:2-octaprenyl-6-methoxyphenol hydroxylase
MRNPFQSNKTVDITIIGGGAGGLSLAILLGQAGLNVYVVDPNTPPPSSKIKESGRTAALMNSSVEVLKSAGAWDALEPYSSALRTMRIIDDSIAGGTSLESAFHADELEEDQYGFNIPNIRIVSALYERARTLKTLTIIKDTFEDFTGDEFGVTTRLSSGKAIRSAILIGADGRNSNVRAMAQIDTWRAEYGQSAITCLIEHDQPHHNIATEFHRGGGPCAFVPLPGLKSSVVWVNATEDAEDLMALSQDNFEERLQAASNGIIGTLSVKAGPESWPLSSLKAKSLSAPRVALIAEAAHAMSPITAQGLNLSLRDVASLAETLIAAKRLGQDLGSQATLKTYESSRSADIDLRVHGVDMMNRVVGTSSTPMKHLRRAGLKTVESILPLKIMAMKHGLAPKKSGKIFG